MHIEADVYFSVPYSSTSTCHSSTCHSSACHSTVCHTPRAIFATLLHGCIILGEISRQMSGKCSHLKPEKIFDQFNTDFNLVLPLVHSVKLHFVLSISMHI